MKTKKIVLGITGASGAPYAKRLAEILRASPGVEVAACASKNAPDVWRLECGGDLFEEIGVPVHRGYEAPFASGSAGWDAMVIAPCSMGTLARVAHGISDDLLTRAADVMLKEKRALVVMPRETPLSVVHLENMLTLARAGAVILPAMPSFYGKPESVERVIDTVVARALDHLGVPNELTKRWGER